MLNRKSLSSSPLLTDTFFKDMKDMTLFPTMGSVKDVFDLGDARLPITNRNDLNALLFTFQNTLLAQKPATP